MSDCLTTVHETVCVQANVTITPDVEVGTIETFCIGGPTIGACAGTPQTHCTFSVSQSICVQIPLTFSANATAVPAGIVCGTPAVGQCTTPVGQCTTSCSGYSYSGYSGSTYRDEGDK